MTIRQLRLLRGSAASCIATLLAALSHTLGGGSPPHPLLILAVAVLLIPVSALLVGSRIRLAGLTAAVAATQFVFHGIFEVTGGITPTGLALGAHHHGAIVLDFGASGTADPSLLAASPVMLVAHLAAALVTTALLWRGELLVQAIARWVRAKLRAPQPVLQHGSDLRVPVSRSVARVSFRLLADCAWRRGPPVPALSIFWS